jgi:prepilin-type N-terminal cleavage/methylation domain-containing protein/prepilin-type processing-associated H-X9-DG protein
MVVQGLRIEMSNTSLRRIRGFTLVELLVVIGVITILIAMLLPTLTRAREKANTVKCMSNLRQIGIEFNIYCNNNRGWIFPPGFGTNVPPHARWPMIVFKIPTAPLPPKYNPALYDPNNYDPVTFPPAPYTPPIMLCPSDENPKEGHSYILNSHIAYNSIKAGSSKLGSKTSSEVIVMGEKVTSEGDYYMEINPGGLTDFDRLVDKYRHGIAVDAAAQKLAGSNYLFLDWHVETLVPDEAKRGMDPWDVP